MAQPQRKKKLPPPDLNLTLRTAALAIDDRGSLRALAEKAGLKYHALRAAILRGYLTPEQRLALADKYPELLSLRTTAPFKN